MHVYDLWFWKFNDTVYRAIEKGEHVFLGPNPLFQLLFFLLFYSFFNLGFKVTFLILAAYPLGIKDGWHHCFSQALHFSLIPSDVFVDPEVIQPEVIAFWVDL